jgi:cytoskeletal protein RodZ
MLYLILAGLSTGFFAYQAYKQDRRIKKQHEISEANARLERQKFYYQIILAIVTSLLGVVGQLMIENHKQNNKFNKTSFVKVTSQKDTKTLSTNSITKTNSPGSDSSISKSRYKSQCPGNSELMSNWKPAQEHPKYPNLIASNKRGIWKPKPGFVFVNNQELCDLRVKPVPKKNLSNSDSQ